MKKIKIKNLEKNFFVKLIKDILSKFIKIMKVIKYCNNIRTPVTLMDNKNAVERANNIIFVYLRSLFFKSFSNILKLIKVQIIQPDIKGISFGLNNDCPNKYG